MYRHTARLYDVFFRGKDYAAESARIRDLVAERARVARPSIDAQVPLRLLDVACGTGRHLEHLRNWFVVEGVEQEPNMLAIARQRLPGVPLHEGDMRSFRLGRRFDVVTCLFSAIGYARTRSGLREAIRSMAAHLAPGGVLIVEPWIFAEQFIDGHVGSDLVEQDGVTIARVGTSRVVRRADGSHESVLELHWLVAERDASGRPTVRYVDERHELGLFTIDEYAAAFRACGMDVAFDAEGLIGRGLFIATMRPRVTAQTVYMPHASARMPKAARRLRHPGTRGAHPTL